MWKLRSAAAPFMDLRVPSGAQVNPMATPSHTISWLCILVGTMNEEGHFEKGAWILDKDPNIIEGVAGSSFYRGCLLYLGQDGKFYTVGEKE